MDFYRLFNDLLSWWQIQHTNSNKWPSYGVLYLCCPHHQRNDKLIKFNINDIIKMGHYAINWSPVSPETSDPSSPLYIFLFINEEANKNNTGQLIRDFVEDLRNHMPQ